MMRATNSQHFFAELTGAPQWHSVRGLVLGMLLGLVLSLVVGLVLGMALPVSNAHAQGNVQVPATAQVPALAIDPAATRIDLAQVSELLEDPEGKLTLAEVQQPANARRFVRKLPNIGFTTSAYWLRFTLVSNTDRPLVRWFNTQNRTLQEVALFSPDGNGVYQRQSASSALPFAERPLHTAYFVFPLTLMPKKPTEIYLRVRSTGYLGVIIATQLWQPKAWQALEKSQTTQWILYLGMAAALALFNLMLAILIKNSHYLLYAASVVAVAWGMSSSSGGFASVYEYFWPDSPAFEQSARVLSTFAATCFSLAFFMKLTHFRAKLPRMALFVQLCLCVFALTIASSLSGTLPVLPKATQIAPIAQFSQTMYMISAGIFMLIYTSFFVSLLWLAWHGNRQAKFICVAWLPMILATGTIIIRNYLFGQSASIGLVMWASAFELILMALALADLFNQEKQAKERAQADGVRILRHSEQELEQKIALQTRELQQEQMRAKELLHGILPADIATELSQTGSARPALHDSVTILFTNFIDFSQSISGMSAKLMVAELNGIFAAFDDITQACGVEKIKTIGDTYMAAAGLPQPCADHALRCVRAARMMVEHLAQHNAATGSNWSIRVGIHSGPAISGVVGKRKFVFDLWGDTVNTAARFEAASENGRINVSAYTCDLIREEFQCEYRGKREVKGKGAIDMYFVAPTAQSARAI